MLTTVIAVMVFSVALDLKVSDFVRSAQMPKAIAAGLLPQLLLLPVATWLATLVLPLPAGTEAGMILVACCPGGALSNVLTHWGRGNAALSMSISALSGLFALVLTPFNFTWMVASNPNTADWLRSLAVNPKEFIYSLLFILAIPTAAGVFMAQFAPDFSAHLRKTLSRLCSLLLFMLIVFGIWKNKNLLSPALSIMLAVVVVHNASGIFLGWVTAKLFKVSTADARAIMLESGMQNSGLALGIIALQFSNDFNMFLIASLWGIWHIFGGLGLVAVWRLNDAKANAQPVIH